MRKGIRGFLVGVIMTSMLTGVAFAGGVNQAIQVVFNAVNITVNGQKVAADNILYNGTTYVPLRAVAEILGKEVGWDGTTNTASITDKGATSQPSTTQAPTGYSRTNPAPIGVSQKITVVDVIDNYTAEVTVKEVVRGDAAWQKIIATNQFNKEPGSDEEYILAKIYIKATQIKDDKKINISIFNFDPYSTNNAKYDIVSVVTPEPNIDAEIFTGAEHEGYVVYKVKKTDSNPKMAFGLKYDGTGGIWFKLQ